MADGTMIPLMFDRVKPVDIGSTYIQGQQYRGLQRENAEGDDRLNALRQYDQQQRAGNPNAIDSLNAHPQAMAQITQARNAMSTEQRTKFDWTLGKRANMALATLQHPSGSDDRQKAWDSGLKELLQVGAISREEFSQLYGKPSNDLLLQQYAAMGGMDFIKLQEARKANAEFAQNYTAAQGGQQPPAVAPVAPPAQAAPQQAPAAAAGPAGAPPMTRPQFPPSPINPGATAAPGATPGPVQSVPPAAPAAAPPAGGGGGWPVPADVLPEGQSSVVTPPAAAAAPAAPAAARQQQDARVLEQSLNSFGNPNARAQMAAVSRGLVNALLDPKLREFAQKEYDRIAKEQELTNDQKEYVAAMRQRMQAADPLRPVVPFDVWKTDDLKRRYDIYTEDERRRGNEAPKSFEEWHLNTLREASNKPEKTEEIELTKGRTKRINDAADNYQAAFANREMLGRLSGLLERSGTGPSVALAQGLRKWVGEDIAKFFADKDQVDAAEGAGALLAYMMPRMRVVGTGATSDRDLQAFKDALPSLMSSAEGRKIVIETLGGIWQMEIDGARIARQVQNNKLKSTEYDDKVEALGDPFANYKKWQEKKNADPNSPTGAGAASADMPLYQSVEEAYAAAKAGGKFKQYRLPDGRIGNVPPN
jgi:hypothetical protein